MRCKLSDCHQPNGPCNFVVLFYIYILMVYIRQVADGRQHFFEISPHMAAGNKRQIPDRVENLLTRYFKLIVLVLLGVQVVKGTALFAHAYARSQYLWSYEFGFIKRGLIGTIALYFNEGSQYRIIGIINFFSYFTFFLFLYFLYRFIMRNAQTFRQKAIAILFLSSPFVLAIGSLLGYFDAIILTILLGIYYLCENKKIPVAACLLLIALALAIHELSLFFVVIPSMYIIWMHPDTNRPKKIMLLVATSVLCLVYIVAIYAPNQAFNDNLNEKVLKYKHVLSTRTGEDFFTFFSTYALTHNFLHDFKIPRLGMLVPLMPIYGFFVLITNWLVLRNLFPLRKYITILLYLTACYLPLLIIVVGWDVDRFVCLSICTSYIAYVEVSKAYAENWNDNISVGQFYTGAVVALIALFTYYPLSENYAEGETLLSRTKQRVLLQYPDRLISTWKRLVLPYQSKFYPPAKKTVIQDSTGRK